MNGQETTELKLSEVLEDNEDFRFDSEYFKKEYMRNSKLFESKPQLKKYSRKIVCGPFGSNILDNFYQESGVIIIRPFNLKNLMTEDDNLVYVSPDFVARNNLKLFHEGDLLFARVGDVACGVLTHREATISPNIIAVEINKTTINAYFLSAFFNTTHGLLQLKRQLKVVAQPTISTSIISKLRIPDLSANFQSQIGGLVKQAHVKLEESKALYTAAENLLLDELGSRSFAPATENTAVKSFRESFLQTGRLDAEYYHPEKDSMLDWLAKFQGKSIGSYASLIDERIDPNQGFSSELVGNFDLTDALEIYLDDKEPIPAYELGSTKKVMKKGDVVISRLRSYLKEIAIVDTPEELTAVGSSEFIVLRLDDEVINAETLLVYLRSLPVQQILKWCQSGSNHPRFMEEDLLAIKLPDKVLALQNTFQLNIRAAINRSRESKRLLETAKRAVEIAIEEDEQAALAFIRLV